MKKIIGICAGAVVGGIMTFGAVAPAGAADFGPALNIGSKIHKPGGQIDALPTPYTTNILTVPLGSLGKVLVGGPAPAPSDGSVSNFLADPLPVTVCALCHPVSTDVAS